MLASLFQKRTFKMNILSRCELYWSKVGKKNLSQKKFLLFWEFKKTIKTIQKSFWEFFQKKMR